MFEFPDSFRKAITSLDGNDELTNKASQVRVFSSDGHPMTTKDDLQSSRVFRRMDRELRSLNRNVNGVLLSLENEAEDRDNRIREEAKNLLPPHVRTQMSGICPTSEDAPYQIAYAGFIDGISSAKKPKGVSGHIQGYDLEEKVCFIVDTIDDIFKKASDGLTVAINRQPMSAILGILCEQRGRAYGLSPLSHEGIDLFPRVMRPIHTQQPAIGISDPIIEMGAFPPADMSRIKDILRYVGKVFAEGKGDPETIKKEASLDIVSEFSRQLMNIPETYEVKVSYSTDMMKLIQRAQDEIRNNGSLADTPPITFDENGVDKENLIETAKKEAKKAADILKIKHGNLSISFNNVVAMQNIVEESIPTQIRFLERIKDTVASSMNNASYEPETGYGFPKASPS